jgi:hypothetical protein
LDKLITSKGFKMARSADDFGIMTKMAKDTDQAWSLVKAWTEASGFTPRPDKRFVGNGRRKGGGFEFLG